MTDRPRNRLFIPVRLGVRPPIRREVVQRINLRGGISASTLAEEYIYLGQTYGIATAEGTIPGLIFTNPMAAQEAARLLESRIQRPEEVLALLSEPERLLAILKDALQGQAGSEATEPASSPPGVAALCETLQALEWSQAKLARKLGVDPNTVSRWVTGRVPVPTWALEYLSAVRAVKDLARKLEL